MNNESGSALQKASFALLVFIAAALGYLIVRDRIRTEERAVEAQTAAAASASVNPATQPTPWNPAEMKSSFAPLRPRSETTIVRVVTNRVPIVLRTNFPVVTATDPQIAALPTDSSFSSGPVVPVTVAIGGAGRQIGASVSGRVTLRGTPPPEKVITSDPMCTRLHPGPFITRHFVVGAEGGLANTFVYIKAGASPTAAIGPGGTLDQIGCEFQPYVMGVQAGQTFNVKNSDPVLHNIHPLPRRPGNRERNVAQPTGTVTPFVFNSPEVFVQFKCEVHPWMFAYVGVVDHPWFAVTDQNGNFTLPAGLAPGRYTIAAVHLKAGEKTREINVTDHDIEPLTFTLDVPNALAKTNKP